MIDIFQNIILPLITIVCGGGWFINYQSKKAVEREKSNQERTTTLSEKVDLTEKVFEKYQKTVLDSMGDHEKRHDKLDKDVEFIAEEIKSISDYLNGGYVQFKKTKKNDK